ncbi:MAG: hypothetical protein Q7N87_04465 [Candidatus Uhrbacteria bacterium]|nr:hypothetical protein [Candidatus Uhrbacteria bacterium]
MNQYLDLTYGFSFWYPNTLKITSSTMQNDTAFPGGVIVERLVVGPADGPTISVVDSPTSSITDEPTNHASPISQTKYFYETTSGQWMVVHPEDVQYGSRFATTTADVSKKTIGGLTMLPTGLRFDATIIPLSTTRFLVINDGGTGLAPSLAKTVTLSGASIDASIQSNALKEEAGVYAEYAN